LGIPVPALEMWWLRNSLRASGRFSVMVATPSA
jgi:hypothetical protein